MPIDKTDITERGVEEGENLEGPESSQLEPETAFCDDGHALVIGEDEKDPETPRVDGEGDVEMIDLEPVFVEARRLFVEAEVLPCEAVELQWREPDEDGLRKFLCDRMGFNVDRVNTGIKKLKEAQLKKAQKRMDR